MTKHLPAGSVRTAFSRALRRASRRKLRSAAVWTVLLLASALLAAGPQTSAPTAASAASCANPIVCENQLPGTPQSTWDMTSNEGGTIQGFADPFSVNIGNSINFKVQSAATSYDIDIYRIGYYGGDGARLVATLTTPNISVSQNQPACNTNTVTGLVDCGNWGVSATWQVPTTAVSGMYIADLVRTDGTTDMNQIPFVVTNNASTSQIVMMTNDETWQAYNDWGGYSFYAGDSTGEPWCCTSAVDPGRAVQISYNRPITTRWDAVNAGGSTYFFSDEYPMIRFLEENGYDVTYVSQSDVSASGAATMLEQHKVFLTAGHSEYWDTGDRSNVTAARNAGVNVAFFTGNTMTWETRWAASQYGNEADRTLVLYKESWDNAQTDPEDPPVWTGYWRDPRFSPPADGAQPENALTGQLWGVDCCAYADTVPSTYSKLQIWRNTAVANLSAGQTYTMPPDTLGYEWDQPVDNGFQPAGEIDMSQTCETVQDLVLDIESDTGTGKACNSLTMYKAASGALVFDAGTIQWAWGLDSDHDGSSQNPPDPVMQQVTVNILADMSAQPATLMSGLVAGAASTDTTPPTSTITSPSAGASFANGSTVTISGTATDAGGGVVAGVEVSTNDGSTWHPVTTMSTPNTSVTWSYTWSAAGSGSVTILSRATDDSANMEKPGPGVTVTVNCPCGLFGANYVPAVTAVSDSTPEEVGVKFQSSISGWVNGVRFYKGSGNGGTHTGSLWSASGTLLATGTFTNETASGWQSLLFATPVQIGPNTTYVVSYYAPDGHYAMDQDLFDWALNTPPLTALKSDYIDAGAGNGVFNEGGPGFPTSSFEGSSYGVDVIFATTGTSTPPTVNSSTPVTGSSSNPVTTDPSVTFNQPVVASSVSFTVKDSSGNSVAGSTSLSSGDTVATFTPSANLAAGTTFTVTVSGAQNSTGQTMASPYSYTFISSKSFPATCPCTVWPDVAPSTATDADDTAANNIGVQFKASENGTISGVRFYKEPDDTGTHTGTLWTAGGTQLATGTFTSEPTQGWAELDFSTPVSITAGTTYVASYQTPTGHYALTVSGLSSPVTNGPLTAVNGVYAYGSGLIFPTNTYSNSNFWVDVVFNPGGSSGPPPSVTGSTPVTGSSSNPVTTDPSVTFSEAVVPSSVSFTVKDSSGNTVAGSTSFSSGDTVATFTPSANLAAGATFSVTVSGAQNSSGQLMASPYSYTFISSKSFPATCPCTVWPDVAPSGATDANDTAANNIGVQFKASENGTISGVRFYKEPDDTGTHTGTLWTAGGTQLATGTFTSEPTQGWAELDFSTPVSITAGTTYVASYQTPTGHYALTTNGFSSPVTNGPLTAVNGVYAYGSGLTFPTNTYSNSNFWVDVVFSASSGGPAPTVTGSTPVTGSSSNPVATDPTVTFSETVVPSSVSFTVKDSSGNSVAGSTSFNSGDTVATFTPSANLAAGTTFTVTVSGAQNSTGQTMASPYSYSFISSKSFPATCPCTVWPDVAPSTASDPSDSSPNNIGVQFKASENGTITGIRFYKEPDDTGTHTGTLWTASGTQLATGTFTSEPTQGWAELDFSTPVSITAGTTYVASYQTQTGHYAITLNGLSSPVTNGPLTAVNGVYAYGSGLIFPTNTYSNSNFWVDVIFQPS